MCKTLPKETNLQRDTHATSPRRTHVIVARADLASPGTGGAARAGDENVRTGGRILQTFRGWA